jgi:hypothetical protein
LFSIQYPKGFVIIAIAFETQSAQRGVLPRVENTRQQRATLAAAFALAIAVASIAELEAVPLDIARLPNEQSDQATTLCRADFVRGIATPWSAVQLGATWISTIGRYLVGAIWPAP